tara:strand:+ start:361 stop:690 length:330 start_codon:yes stop_codon:yes gene_type:complete
MKQTDFELLQPVEYQHMTGYISFISEHYISIVYKEVLLPDDVASRWGRHYSTIIVYPQFWHEIRSRLDETEEEQEESPRSDLLQFGRRRKLGTTHKQDGTRKDEHHTDL